MEYLEVSLCDDFRAVEIYRNYCQTFPADERRSDPQFRALFANPKVKIFAVLDHLQDVGYLICWELTDFVFLEHFEIFSDFRSKKYGSQIIADLIKRYSRIVLEAEPSDLNEDAKRRISFYERNGFSIIEEAYIQPAYDTEKKPLDLWLLANWKPEKTDWIKEELYDVVYC
ncbi:GNAT family N-acetyltransferase [Chryseobacterium sp. SNU WT5]|uniref:GNAT family N-acetyltransferase n=1 Tax=Chryseobacterium sp. SNU WT5 TaxID=2594269 RepID=UPI00117E50DA|nr:GNAT family N-acetyltransferase [Chryseobacterium sp. SNU WT5]QDP85612.1 GNAT family N-acetyltransferase [Chryseobacterium sp. SNU WT5]